MLDRLVFWPPKEKYRTRTLAAQNPDARAYEIGGRAGSIAVVYLRNPRARFTVICSHGNAEQLSTMLPNLRRLHRVGLSVVGYDYRGYGASEGHPTEYGVYEDAESVYDFAADELSLRYEYVISYGWSLGAAVALELSLRRSVAGLILEAPFLSAPLAVTPGISLPFDTFRNIEKIGRVACPLVIIHGCDDEVVPVEHGRTLFDMATAPKRAVWVRNGGHCDLFQIAPERCFGAVRGLGLWIEERRRKALAKAD